MKLSVYNSASLSRAVAILVALFPAVSTSVIAREFRATGAHSNSLEPPAFADLTFAGSGVT